MTTAKDVFQVFKAKGDKALEILREKAFQPHDQKSLRFWNITEASQLVKRTPQNLRILEKEGKIPKPIFINNKRAYSLSNINNIRDIVGTRPHKETEIPCILAVANFKGGASKTTTAIHAAHYFARAGYNILVIDADSQASITQIFGYNPDESITQNDTIYHALTESDVSIESSIRKTNWEGLDLIPANLSLYQAEFDLPVKMAKALAEKKAYPFYAGLSNSLKSIYHKYDIIIIDCPPSMGTISFNAIYAANSLLIPSPPAMLDFTSTIQFFNMLYEVLEDIPEEKKYHFIRILITKHERRNSNDTLVSLFRNLYGDYVMSSIMYMSEAIKKASGDMTTLYEVSKYVGSKSTYDKAINITDEVNRELGRLIETNSLQENTKEAEKLSFKQEEQPS